MYIYTIKDTVANIYLERVEATNEKKALLNFRDKRLTASLYDVYEDPNGDVSLKNDFGSKFIAEKVY